MRFAAFAFVLLAFCPALGAHTADVERAEIVWAGLYRASILGTVTQPNTAIGRTNQLGDIEKLETTTTVPVRIGVNFGFEYTLVGAPDGGAATVTVVVVPPKAGLLNPQTQQRVYRETWSPSVALVGATTLIGYLLEQDWELVPGLWRFEIWLGDRKVGEQSFCLVEEAMPDKPDDTKAQEEACHSAATA
jgi:Domain of unknown function (DUF3859)